MRKVIAGLFLWVGMTLLGRIGSVAAQSPSITDSLRARLSQLAQADQFAGVVLLADRDRVVFQEAYGLASRRYGVPNRVDTKFNLASLGKTFTAVAIGQLVEQGKLRWTDTLIKVLPDYPNREVGAKVTIRQLLTHTSGMGLYWDKLFAGNWTAVRTGRDLLPFYADDPLQFEPGHGWSYSNAGFAVLGLVIEKVSGEDYFSYIQRHVFDPAGMKDSGYFSMEEEVPNLATGYFRDSTGAVRNNLFTHTVKGGGAGGGFSTAPDLLRFARALRSHRLLSAATTELMMSQQTATDRPSDGYGYGFQIMHRNGVALVGHTGGFAGIGTLMFINPNNDRIGILVSNDPDPGFGPAWRWISTYLTAS
jgi:CubicO group peptidase (beta-lactamase class C family)